MMFHFKYNLCANYSPFVSCLFIFLFSKVWSKKIGGFLAAFFVVWISESFFSSILALFFPYSAHCIYISMELVIYSISVLSSYLQSLSILPHSYVFSHINIQFQQNPISRINPPRLNTKPPKCITRTKVKAPY